MSFRFNSPVTQWTLLAMCGVLLLVWSLARPHYNWDMLAYSAATQRFASADPEQWHQSTYEDARRFLASGDFQRLVGTDPHSFRARASADPDLFAAHLDFYTGRVAYIGATWLLEAIGLQPLRAQHVLCGLATLAGLLFLALLIGSLRPDVPLIVLPGIAAVFGLLQILRLGTPDALTFAAVCGVALLLVRRERALLLLLPVALAVRTDLLLFTLPLYVFLWRERAFARPTLLASVLGSLLLFVVLQWDHPGWARLVQVTFFEPMASAGVSPAPVGSAAYVLLLKRGLVTLLDDKAALLFLLLAVSALIWARARLHSDSNDRVLLFLIANSLLYSCVHFLLFPVFWERFFVGTYCVTAVAWVCLMRPTLSRRQVV